MLVGPGSIGRLPFVAGVSSRRCVSSANVAGQRTEVDRTGKAAVPDTAILSVPAACGQPNLEPYVGVRRRLDNTSYPAEGRHIFDGIAVRRVKNACGIRLCGRDRSLGKAHGRERIPIRGTDRAQAPNKNGALNSERDDPSHADEYYQALDALRREERTT